MTANTTGGSGGITKTGKRRLRNGCVFSVLFMGIGFYGGLSAAKKAIDGPDWMRRITGIVLPQNTTSGAAPIAQVNNSNNFAPPAVQQTDPNRAQQASNPAVAGTNQPGSGSPQQNSSAGTQLAGSTGNGAAPAVNPSDINRTQSNPSAPSSPPAGGWLVGTWEITDELHPTGSKSSSVTSQYIFDDGGTGEFATNGKKLYDLHWEDAGDYILLTFVTDTEGEQNLKVKMKYSQNSDHTLLTLAPLGKKDPREEMYSVGPGVFHRR